MKGEQKWPDLLWIVRHGESAGNVARDAAVAARQHIIDITTRDVDVPLSELGKRQAAALGQWVGTLPEDRRPEVITLEAFGRAIPDA